MNDKIIIISSSNLFVENISRLLTLLTTSKFEHCRLFEDEHIAKYPVKTGNINPVQTEILKQSTLIDYLQ